MSMAALALLAATELVLIMSAGWVVQRWTRNCGWVDVAWTLGTGLAGVTFALAPMDAAAPHPRQLIVAALAAAWALRLAIHIALRAAKGIDDPRYAALRVEWGERFEVRLYAFLMLQAAVAFGLALSIGLAARNPAPLGPSDIVAVAILTVAILGEAMADRSLRRFKADPANRGRVCDAGLWGWSRHPNYFFEALAWVAYPVFALAGFWPWGWIAVSGPVLMFWALRFASGVPPLERHMAARYGRDWESYAARVSVFIPRPPRRKEVA